jgi:putative transposase
VPGIFVPALVRETVQKGTEHGEEKEAYTEQIVILLRQIEVAVANGKTTPVACRENGITEQTYYRWRKECGGLQVDQARQLKELEQENAKLKRLVSELSLEKLVLKDIASGNVWSAPLLQAQGCF